ncbi:hypothetical protein LMG29542_00200 [Paraburkholderia humisilvae]|uniref:Proteinase inhibitor n=1 Tax=Paraburkholderia humisilvae TaxID=627669 RepID=A0A6J5CZ36_9BURK|nr:hypothetical protein LMG29542_00200 [Paraburkholderia humisilvae]
MPEGKPAGVRCVQLGDDLRCTIFGKPERPACCSGLQPQAEMCGASRADALVWLARLEHDTRPERHDPACLPPGPAHASSMGATGKASPKVTPKAASNSKTGEPE